MTEEEWKIRQNAYQNIPEAFHSKIYDRALEFANMTVNPKLKKGGKAWEAQHEMYYHSAIMPLTDVVIDYILDKEG